MADSASSADAPSSSGRSDTPKPTVVLVIGRVFTVEGYSSNVDWQLHIDLITLSCRYGWLWQDNSVAAPQFTLAYH